MSKKILVADNSSTIRKVAESLLEKQGYEVLCAKDGTSAWDMAKTKTPDLIFWDDSLPNLDGHSVCEKVKKHDELKNTPVIILLTKDQKEKEEELKQVGADGFMVKPFNPKDILKTVEEFLKREKNDSRDKMRKGSKDEHVDAGTQSNIDKTGEDSTLSKKEKKKDEPLDILESNDFMVNFEASTSGSHATEPHGFDWFMSELRKETEEAEKVDFGGKKESKEEILSTEITSFSREDLKKSDKDKKKAKVYEIDKDYKRDEDFVSELKRELEESEVEQPLDKKIPAINYDKMIQELIESISTKIAQEMAKKIDPEILKQIVRDEVEKLRKEEVKAR
jgi:DNA-binding response OmpR family regulator